MKRVASRNLLIDRQCLLLCVLFHTQKSGHYNVQNSTEQSGGEQYRMARHDFYPLWYSTKRSVLAAATLMKIQYFTRYGVVEFFFHLLRNLRSHFYMTSYSWLDGVEWEKMMIISVPVGSVSLLLFSLDEKKSRKVDFNCHVSRSLCGECNWNMIHHSIFHLIEEHYDHSWSFQ